VLLQRRGVERELARGRGSRGRHQALKTARFLRYAESAPRAV
jgi:hypothetical protein